MRRCKESAEFIGSLAFRKNRCGTPFRLVGFRGANMPELDPAILNLLEDIEIALILAERSGGGPDVPLAEIAARLGIDLDNL